MAWNYKEVSSPKLSEEFRQLYVVSLKGKEAMLYNGLLLLGFEKGLKSLGTTIVQYPNKDNEWTAIIEAKLVGYGWNPIENKLQEVTFSCIGDANPKNCTSMVAAAFVRMADTRAKARVLRDYTGIGMVALEEMGASVTEDEKMTPQQLNQISAISKTLGISKEDNRKEYKVATGKDDPRQATEQDAETFINHLKKLKKQQDQKAKNNDLDENEDF